MLKAGKTPSRLSLSVATRQANLCAALVVLASKPWGPDNHALFPAQAQQQARAWLWPVALLVQQAELPRVLTHLLLSFLVQRDELEDSEDENDEMPWAFGSDSD